MKTAANQSKKPTTINAEDIATLTARLAQLMAEEVDLLDAMKVKEIEKLQDEKLFLIDALETYKKLFKRQPELSESIPSKDKRDLAEVIDVFESILEQNQQKLLMARSVNEQMVNAIRDVVAEKAQTPYYGNRGTHSMSSFEHNSITLNEQV